MLRIALCQLNYTVGDIEGNIQKIISSIKFATEQKADVAVFSELAVCGYPPYDLLFDTVFVDRCISAIEQIAAACENIVAIVGGIDKNPGEGKPLFNTAFVLHNGNILHRYYKALLPTYDIFDEARYFEPSQKPLLFEYQQKKIAVTICEDLWTKSLDQQPDIGKPLYHYDIVAELATQQPDLLINIAASPFSYTQITHRYSILNNAQKQLRCPLIYVNQIGAHTDLIFDGGSIYIDSNGSHTCKFFEEDTEIIDLEKPTFNQRPDNTTWYIYEALKLGIKDFFHRNGFRKALIGLSGGIDSALVTILAADALGHENVHVLLLPSQYSSEHSITDSIELCKRNHISYDIIPIESVFNEIEKTLLPVFNGKEADVTEENIQSRIRAIFLMAYSNKHGHVLLNTSNKSEMATGYGTLYGDMCGALSVLGDVYKTQVYEIATYINSQTERIPNNIIQKAPSAELRPNQKDTDTLPEYPILDAILFQLIEQQQPISSVIAMGYEKSTVEKVFRWLYQFDYKRFQAPPVLRISPKAFGFGRRIPLVKKIIL